MKLILLCALLFSTSAFARQYIQCNIAGNSSSDVMVVNLQDPGKQSTLFLSSGMENSEDERLLVKIQFSHIEAENSVFKVIDEVGTGSVSIPTLALGQSSNGLNIELVFSGLRFDYLCFSRIYHD